jgi:LacI family transcriptional regulator
MLWKRYPKRYPKRYHIMRFYMPNKKGVVTIKDVAKIAGVSVSTVSRVLNKKDYISTETQERVQTVIDQFGFTSSLAARSMRSNRKNLLGLVVLGIGGSYTIEITKGINKAIVESGFDLLTYTTGDLKKSDSLTRYISYLNKSLTDGVVILAYAPIGYDIDSPIVAVDPPDINPNYPSIRGNNYQGALDAVNYLIGLGHRRIGYIGGPPKIANSIFRLKGYRDELLKAGILVDESLIMSGDFGTDSGNKCARELLSMENPPTAIFASNDLMAIGVFRAAQELGLRIPEDLSVIGFDNISEAQSIGLTTIDQSLSEIGYQSILMLIKLINKEELDSQVHEVPTKLIVRGSCRELRPQQR